MTVEGGEKLGGGQDFQRSKRKEGRENLGGGLPRQSAFLPTKNVLDNL